jgi:hypothetical protein
MNKEKKSEKFINHYIDTFYPAIAGCMSIQRSQATPYMDSKRTLVKGQQSTDTDRTAAAA